MSSPEDRSAGKVVAVCTSTKKGTVKRRVGEIRIRKGHGVLGDAHAGPGPRQVSLLEDEKIALMRAKGLSLKPGAFGENIVSRGVAISSVEPGTTIRIGARVALEVTIIGKECHTRCAIYYKTGECIMPVYGVFTRVVRGGTVRAGDTIRLVRCLATR